MSEDEKEKQEGTGAGEPAEDWPVSVARSLGSVTQRAVRGLDSLASWAKSALAESPDRRRVVRRREPLRPLLEKLAELLEKHRASGYDSVERDPQFWAVVRMLHSRRPYLRAVGKVRRRAPPDAAPGSAQPGAPPQAPTEPAQQDASSKRRSKKARAEDTGSEGGAPEAGDGAAE